MSPTVEAEWREEAEVAAAGGALAGRSSGGGVEQSSSGRGTWRTEEGIGMRAQREGAAQGCSSN